MVLLRPSNEVLPRARVRGAQDYRGWPSIALPPLHLLLQSPYNVFFCLTHWLFSQFSYMREGSGRREDRIFER